MLTLVPTSPDAASVEAAEIVAVADPVEQEPPAWPLPIIGDPTLGGDGVRIPVDADCPSCGWPERAYDTMTRRFGCIRCPYTSDERNG